MDHFWCILFEYYLNRIRPAKNNDIKHIEIYKKHKAKERKTKIRSCQLNMQKGVAMSKGKNKTGI